MPVTQVVFYQEEDGRVPFFDWFARLDPVAQAKCLARLRRLELRGHELRRPEADFLSDGVYELRATRGRVNLRILYFFQGTNIVIVSHGLMKEQRMPRRELDLAISRKRLCLQNPSGHIYRGGLR